MNNRNQAEAMMAKARRASVSAQLLLTHGDAVGACDRAFYAMLQAALAVMELAGESVSVKSERDHVRLFEAFSSYLTRTQFAPLHMVETLRQSDQMRRKTYMDFYPISIEEASQQVEEADRFVAFFESALTDEMRHLALFKALSEGAVSGRHVIDVTGLSWGEVIVAMNRYGLRLPRVDPSLFLSDERRAFEDAVWEEIARRYHAMSAEAAEVKKGEGNLPVKLSSRLNEDQSGVQSDCQSPERRSRDFHCLIADAGILSQLVSCHLIDEVLSTSSRVVVPDLVATEAQMPGIPFSDEVGLLLQSGKISIASTATGEMFRAALEGDPSFRSRDAVDRAIVDWLLDAIDEMTVPVIVLSSNSRVAQLVKNHNADASIF
ncbi:MAG TPA: hypothetical protein PLK99_11985, partial [Burkholderiales bacterium]|nr:hypothetical protein [Burkholderiales bacterium]